MIVCIGDSITAGQYLPEGEKPWPALITGYEIVNAGVNGDTTRLALERFPRDVQERAPSAVVIQFGLNDCNKWATDRGLFRVSPGAFKSNLSEMTARAMAFGSDPFLCTITPSYRSERHASDVAFYDDIVREVQDHTQCPLVDVNAVFQGRRDLLMDDGLHLNQHGHRLYSQTVQAALDSWFG